MLATPFAAANLYALLAVLPENHALCVFSGMLLAYVCYDLTHYALHHADFRHTPYLVSCVPHHQNFEPSCNGTCLLTLGRSGTGATEIHTSRSPLQRPHH